MTGAAFKPGTCYWQFSPSAADCHESPSGASLACAACHSQLPETWQPAPAVTYKA